MNNERIDIKYINLNNKLIKVEESNLSFDNKKIVVFESGIYINPTNSNFSLNTTGIIV